MRFWGLTGGIGSGKSVVLRILQEKGFPVLDADVIARQLLSPQSEKFSELCHRLAEQVPAELVDIDAGVVDRQGLREWLAQSRQNQKFLEKVLHPFIRAEIVDWMEAQKKIPKLELAFIEASRMIESGLAKILDGVIWVRAPKDLRLERASQRDQIHPEQLQAITALQLPDTEFDANSDYCLDNSGDEKELSKKIDDMLKVISS